MEYFEKINSPIGYVVPNGLRGEDEVFAAISSLLKFPQYFDANWDSFDECISDLVWLDDVSVQLVHEDLPCFSSESDLSIYCDILKSAEQEGKLKVFLAENCRAQIAGAKIDVE